MQRAFRVILTTFFTFTAFVMDVTLVAAKLHLAEPRTGITFHYVLYRTVQNCAKT